MSGDYSKCPASLNIAGEHFDCDWPVDEAGRHDGWGHANGDARALWCDDRWGRVV